MGSPDGILCFTQFDELKSLVGVSEDEFTALLGIATHEAQECQREGIQGNREPNMKYGDVAIGHLLGSGYINQHQSGWNRTAESRLETGQVWYVMK